MNNIILVLLPIIFFFSANKNDNNNNINLDNNFDMNPPYDYEQLWKEVDSHNRKGLPKSALEIVDKIYSQAKSENNGDQYIKAIIHKFKFKQEYQDETFEKELIELEKEAEMANFPTNAVLNFFIADLFNQYTSDNYYTIMRRSETENFENNDIATWSIQRLNQECIKYLNKSLENKDELLKFKYNHFQLIISKGSKPEECRPTLYDILAYKSIDLIDKIRTTRPETFFLTEDFYFDNLENFCQQEIKCDDSLSLKFNAIKILQDLGKTRLKEAKNAEEALVDYEIFRINYISSKISNDRKQELMKNCLEKLQNKYSDSKYQSGINYTLAKFYYDNVEHVEEFGEGNSQYRKIAYDICDKIVKQDTALKTEYSILAYNLMNNILAKKASFQLEEKITPNRNFVALVNYKNISDIFYKIIKIDYDDYHKIVENEDREKQIEKVMKEGKTVSESSIKIPNLNDYNDYSTEIVLPQQNAGFYAVIFSTEQKFKCEDESDYILNMAAIEVTNLAVQVHDLECDTNEICVVNRTTSEPVSKSTVKLYQQVYSKFRRKWVWEKYCEKQTDNNGFVYIPTENSNGYSCKAIIGNSNDTLHAGSIYFYSHNPAKFGEEVHIFTDRAIYRPGQTIYFKGYALNVDENNKVTPIENKNYTVILRDVNNKEIAFLKLISNEFGTFNGSFEIPTGLLNGKMDLMVNRTFYKSFNVEEYKRPTFEVRVNDIEGEFVANEEITVTGNATSYSGMKVNNAEVRYRIQRKPKFDFRKYLYFFSVRENPIEIAKGQVVTDENGNFEIKFKAEPDPTLGTKPEVAFNYLVSVEITDLNGETRTAANNITVGFSSLALSVSVNKSNFKEDDIKANIYASNLDGNPLNVQGNLKVTKLIDNGLLRNRMWKMPNQFSYTKDEWQKLMPNCVYKDENQENKFVNDKVIISKNFDTQKEISIFLDDLKSAESGTYKIEISAKDPKTGREIKSDSYFNICSKTDKQLPQNDFLSVKNLNNNLKLGEKAKIFVGTSVKNAKILYKVFCGNRLISKEFVTINAETKIIEIPIVESYKGGLDVFFYLIYDGRNYEKHTSISVPYSEKELNIEYQTFRDKLQHGENETWKLKITDIDGKNVSAEMAATMYDKSLDAFAVNNYGISFPFRRNYHQLSHSTPTFSTTSSDQMNRYYPKSKYGYFKYSDFYWFGYQYYNSRSISYMYMGGAINYSMSSPMLKSKRAESAMYMEEDMAMAESMPMAEEKISDMANMKVEANDDSENTENQDINVRENFNETAFFYPELRTDENGEISIEFTMPESLTSWRMMGIAHTKEYQMAFTEKEIVTQKQLMIQPNAPRFFRENDRMILPVKIGNLSEEDLTGKITIEIIDPFTEKTIENVSEVKELTFSVKKGLSSMVEFPLNIPERYSTLAYKIIAKAGNFSDGEKKAIPIMSNRMLVTESLPLPINGNQTKDFKFEKLIKAGNSNTLRHHKLTLEFTSNPAWYAIQALPYMMEYPYECNEQTFNRLYANTIAAHIANSSPKIKAVFDSWKQSNSKELISNLEKNEELKSVLLQETPWVMEGKNETERKQRVALLFDLNRIAGEENKTIEKLKKNQYSSGGWPWFDGMPESNFVTLEIVGGMGHLTKLGINTFKEGQNKVMAEKAIRFIDEEIEKYYKELKKYNKESELKSKNFLNFYAINYLYARSFFSDIAIPLKTKEAFDFYKNQAEKYWLTCGKYQQAMICLALNRFGNNEIPNNILKSLKEKSTSSEEMGMYFADNKAGFLWHEAPIEAQSIIIEAFDEVANDQKTVDLLKIWLLKQKQTTDWKTTKATAHACYALLLRGTDLLANSEICTIKLNDKAVDPKSNPDLKAEAGTGYFKTSWSNDEVKPEMGNVSVTNTNNGVAWGALYWQYFEQLDKITFAETPLKLSKKLFREKVTNTGAVIEPITDQTELKQGDKIVVRIEIRSDRNMEYVHLKDMRAAGFEPVNVFSGYRYQDGLGYYECTKDASTNFFIEFLDKGTHVFEYKLFVQHKGNFSNGITSIQCMYAPEFTAHSEGVRVNVK